MKILNFFTYFYNIDSFKTFSVRHPHNHLQKKNCALTKSLTLYNIFTQVYCENLKLFLYSKLYYF